MSSRPYSKLIEILRYTLERAEQDALLNPERQEVAELKRSIQQSLEHLERGMGSPELDK
jgi:hypothetical protein